MKENSNFLFVIDYFFSISIVDFFVFKCAVYLVTPGNFDIKWNLNATFNPGRTVILSPHDLTHYKKYVQKDFFKNRILF